MHRHREFGGTYRAAHDALLRAEEALSDASTVEEPRSPGNPCPDTRVERVVRRELSCVGCRVRVSRPCWYCIECEGMSLSSRSPHVFSYELMFCPVI